MGNVVLDVSVSVDGFVAGPGVSTDRPMGRDGDRLHDWMEGGDPGHGVALVDELHRSAGAVVIGRRTFDVGIGPWGDVPFAVPCFVVTHRGRPELAQTSGTFTFVTEGIENALVNASEAAGERDVLVMGGETGRQYLAAGLVDELHIHVSPVLLGDGPRLFDYPGGHLVELDRVAFIEAPTATHLRYRVVR